MESSLWNKSSSNLTQVKILAGIYDGAKINSMYKSLLEVMKVPNLTNEEITMKLTTSLGIFESFEIPYHRRNFETGEHAFPDDLKVEVIFMYRHRKFTKKSISALMNLDISEINIILSEFNKKLKTIKEESKKESWTKRCKLNQEYVNYIKELLDKKRFWGITVREIKKRGFVKVWRDEGHFGLHDEEGA